MTCKNCGLGPISCSCPRNKPFKEIIPQERRNYTQDHENLKKRIMMRISEDFENVIALPYDVGFVRGLNNAKKVFKMGQQGVPDLFLIGPDASVRFLDVKTGKSGLSKEQKAFKKLCLSITGKDIVDEIRSEDAAVLYVKRQYSTARMRS